MEAWTRENPGAALGDALVSAGAEAGAAAVEAAGTALLTSIFGEPKSVREVYDVGNGDPTSERFPRAPPSEIVLVR